MFSGMSDHSIDSKSRIVLPAKFREELGDSFYLARGFNNTCIQVMSKQYFETISERIMALPAEKALALQYVFTASAVEVTPNAQGRVIIPQTLREFAGIGSEARVVGMINRVEIWDKNRFESYLVSQQPVLGEAMTMLKL